MIDERVQPSASPSSTDELIRRLARDAGVVARHAVPRRLGLALAAGALPALLLAVFALGLRPDLGDAVHQAMFWVKLAFPAAWLAIAVALAARLARPGRSVGRLPLLLAAPLIAVWLLAAVELAATAPAAHAVLLWGDSWRQCPVYIALLSVPAFVATFAVMRTLAPTRLACAGAAAGLASGALAAAAYALHCTEVGAPFLGLWYVAGMLVPAIAGALLGPRLLRW